MSRKLNPAHLSALMEMVNQSPYFSLLGIRLVQLAPSYARVETDVTNRHLNPFGTIHGGVYASIIDTAAYWAAYCNQTEEAGFTSLDLAVNNLAMANHGRLIATATAVKEGRSICLCEAVIEDENGKILAHGTSKLLMLQGRQSVADALGNMGHPPLPPKFLDTEQLP